MPEIQVFFGIIAFTLPMFRYFLLDTVARIYNRSSRNESSSLSHGPPTIGSAGKNRKHQKRGALTLTDSLFADETPSSRSQRPLLLMERIGATTIDTRQDGTVTESEEDLTYTSRRRDEEDGKLSREASMESKEIPPTSGRVGG